MTISSIWWSTPRSSCQVGEESPGPWVAESNVIGQELGHIVSSAGDVNGDGIDDIIVGSRGFPGGMGRVAQTPDAVEATHGGSQHIAESLEDLLCLVGRFLRPG